MQDRSTNAGQRKKGQREMQEYEVECDGKGYGKTKGNTKRKTLYGPILCLSCRTSIPVFV